MLMRYLVAALALPAMLATPAMAQGAETAKDDVISADVIHIVQRHVFFTIFDNVSVEVQDGVVTLGGQVTEPYKKVLYEKTVLKNVDGVREVVNEIEVLPPSGFDDRIRYIVASRIYNDDRLMRYAIADFPKPIHIIVRNGHLTLEGVVAGKMDKLLVETQARSVGGVVSVTNNLVVK